MKSLYMDTTGQGVELLFKAGAREVHCADEGRQSERIFAAIEKVLGGAKISDLDFVVVITGPGSFTGIRLGLAIAKGFGIAARVPVFGLDRFRAIWISNRKAGRIEIPAGKSEVYVADMDADGNELAPPKLKKVISTSSFRPASTPQAGRAREPESRNNQSQSDIAIDPIAVLEYVEKAGVAPAPLAPLYIKPHYAKVPQK
ncbi:MAG: tRNA (adenosine(37)-N6)-threonylcarbamoyltransferase complex dimerization subunit type 1 TsaB [Rickettsiales bacterium]|jgi:tRNA threonylcarbamoyladenosine biosynthesis protein TsaB|nr:tRNA (adenosine(37)-N6)-threonylcarbamoyltransferase complex dimerization subunit type 1 TsaB [Rickettsiales bacterium]